MVVLIGKILERIVPYMLSSNLHCVRLSIKLCLHTIAGVIDRDYRGNIGVVLFNLSKVDYEGTSLLGKLEAVAPHMEDVLGPHQAFHYLQIAD